MDVTRLRAQGALLSKMARALADVSAEPQLALQVIAAHTADALSAFCGFLRVSEDRSQLDPVTYAAPEGRPLPDAALGLLDRSVPLDGPSLLARAVHERETMHVAAVPDAHLEAAFPDAADRARARELAARSVLIVPVQIKDRVLGVLSVVRFGAMDRPFDDEDLEFAGQLADHAALALSNAELVIEARGQLSRMQLLTEMSREIAGAVGNHQRLLDVIVRKIGESIGDSCVLRLVAEGAEAFTAGGAVYNRDPDLETEHREILRVLGSSFQRTLALRAVETNAPMLLSREQLTAMVAATPAPLRGLLERMASTSAMVVPLSANADGDGPAAVIIVARSDRWPPFTSADRQLLEHLAAHATIAIANARLIESSTRTAERLRALTEAAAAFARSVEDQGAVLDVVVEHLVAALGGTCRIRLIATPFGRPEPMDAANAGSGARDRDVLTLRLAAGRRVIGTVELCRDGAPYTRDEVEFARDLTTHAALAIRNSRLIASVQRELAERERAEAALRTSQDQLRHAQKMDAIGRLAGGVAHDFNNLLSVVLSSCEFITEAIPSDSPAIEDVEQIRRSGLRAAKLTKQLLAFSRQQPLELEILDMNEQVSNMRPLLERLVGEACKLETQLGADLGCIKADATHVEQVIMNLAINARDAMPKGGTLTIETSDVILREPQVTAHGEVTPGRYTMLAVSDTGEGMSETTQLRIFEPFFTTKPRGKGTGLGLSTVFGIVRQNGGSILVHSKVGCGTTFRVYFPRTDETLRPQLAPAEITRLRGTETLLLVEDDDAVRRAIVSMLARNGYRVIESPNGRDALEVYEQHRSVIDLVLTDVMMPIMGGRELAQHLIRKTPDLKLIFMSGYTDDEVFPHDILERGVSLFLKPVTSEGILRKIREVLDATPRSPD